MIDFYRGGDVVGRLGGDEFAILLPATKWADAARVAQRLLTASRSSKQLAPEGAKAVTMSIGLACLPRPVSSEALMQAADDAMYTAKPAGGSRVAYADGDVGS